MARGRLIDKQIYLNEKLAQLSIESRYLYQGMIVHSDDKGRMKANPSLLRALIFPFDHTIRIDTIKLWRDKIVSVGLIKLYVCDETEYLSHPNWEKWQPIRPDRTKPSDCAAPPNEEDIFFEWMKKEIKEGELNPDKKDIPFWLRKKILIRDHFTCRYCKSSLSNDKKLRLSVDHILPFVKGGKTTEENLITCCLSCNCSKKDKTVEEANLRILSVTDISPPNVRHLSDQCQRLPNLTKPNLTPGELRSQCGDTSTGGKEKDNDKDKDKPPKEKDYKITTELQSIVCKYKVLKGLDKDDRSWDKINWSRASKSAKHILEVMGNWEVACDYMDAQSKEFERKRLEWTIETLAKRVDEFKAAIARGDEKWN